MAREFSAGDFLIFQIESGFGLLRVLDYEEDENGELIWHISAYEEMFLDVEMVDYALENNADFTVSIPHVALTNRAFLSTQVSKISNKPLFDNELHAFNAWKENPHREVSDRSVRLMLGLR
jgi:7,8-dihydro-6-hydroxymethylpterin-pyrophosphokinase